MGSPTNEILHPQSIVIPNMTTAVRNTLRAERGTLIYDTTQNKLCFNCSGAGVTLGAGNWEKITSVQET